jgi:hypothetical protein
MEGSPREDFPTASLREGVAWGCALLAGAGVEAGGGEGEGGDSGNSCGDSSSRTDIDCIDWVNLKAL